MHTYSFREPICAQNIFQMLYFLSSEPRSLGGEGEASIMFLGKVRGLFLQSEHFQGLHADCCVAWFNISLGNFLGSWVGSHESFLAFALTMTDLLGIVYENNTLHFEKNALSDGIRLSWSKKRPRWATSPGIGNVPKMLASTVLILSQHTWFGGHHCRGWQCWHKHQNSC